jgi:hypothetical protein
MSGVRNFKMCLTLFNGDFNRRVIDKFQIPWCSPYISVVPSDTFILLHRL